MPRGPNGERRPADAVGCAVTVAKIATGEIEEALPEKDTELARIVIEALTLAEQPKPTTPPEPPSPPPPPSPGPPPPLGPDRTVERAMDPDTVTTT